MDSLQPGVELNQSYANSYERLAASLVELGSGYVKVRIANGMVTICTSHIDC